MLITTEAHFPCPQCEGPGHLSLTWKRDGGQDIPALFKIASYTCPGDCHPDDQILLQAGGAGGEHAG